MSRGTKILLWSLGGCMTVAILVVVAALVVGGIAFSRTFNLRLAGVSAPADFPVYPGARQSAAFGVAARGSSRGAENLVQWQVQAPYDKVASWYRNHLDEADWEVVDEPLPGQLVIRRRSTGAVARVRVQGQLVQTLVQLVMTDDQPLAPGVHPAAGQVPDPGLSP